MTFVIHWETHGVYRKYRGSVDADELLESIQRVEGDARFDALRYVINDCLEVKGIDIPDAKMRLIAAIDSAAALSNPNIRVAVVATDRQIHALTQIYAAMQHPYPTAVFPDLAAARAWVLAAPKLDRPKPALWR